MTPLFSLNFQFWCGLALWSRDRDQGHQS